MNSVNISGRITQKPELRYSNSNVGTCRFSLAVKRRFKNAMGEYDSDFINCTAFNKTAEIITQYADKGDLIGVTGRIHTYSYKGQDDKTKYVTEVVVDNIDFYKPKNAQKNENIVQNRVEKDVKRTTDVQNEDPFADFGEQVSIDDNFLD